MYDGKVFLKESCVSVPSDNVRYGKLRDEFLIFIPKHLLEDLKKPPSKICYKHTQSFRNVVRISCFMNFTEMRFNRDGDIIFVFKYHTYCKDYPEWVKVVQREENLDKILS